MKKLIITTALAIGMAIPFAGVSSALPYETTVKHDERDPNRNVPIWRTKYAKGAYERDYRNHQATQAHVSFPWQNYYQCSSDYRPRYPYNIEVQRIEGPWAFVRVVRTARQERSCRGWLELRFLAEQPPATHIWTGGRWGDEIPVFKTRRAFYSARPSMDRNGHYNGQLGQVACKLRVGTNVDEFKPFRDWGVGEVKAGNCSGWMDRAVIR